MAFIRTLAAFALLAGLGTAASAATIVNYANVPAPDNDNGDLVTTFGSTPQVGITTRSFTSAPGLPTSANHIRFWNAGYGTLPAAVYADSDGLGAEITLTPAAGYSVTLQSFDLADYLSRAPTARLVRVVEAQTGNVLWDGAGANGLLVNTTMTLSPGVSSALGLSVQWAYSWNIGLNNLTFDATLIGNPTVVPVPPAVALFLGGLALMGWVSRKRG